MTNLSQKQIKMLKANAHPLKPVIYLGTKGLSEAVIAETNAALTAHELIKVKIPAAKQVRKVIAHELAQLCDACLIQLLGHMATLYRKNEN